jgi:hypothetical protein
VTLHGAKEEGGCSRDVAVLVGVRARAAVAHDEVDVRFVSCPTRRIFNLIAVEIDGEWSSDEG